MSFIEKIRQEVEQVAAQQKAEAEARRQAQVREEELRARRRHQAEKFRNESGVATLVGELKKFVKELNGPNSFYIGHLSVFDYDYESVWDEVILGSSYIGAGESTIGCDRTKHEVKYIGVETRPDGAIVVRGSESFTIPEAKWKGNRQIIEDALVKAYKSPAKSIEISERRYQVPSNFTLHSPRS